MNNAVQNVQGRINTGADGARAPGPRHSYSLLKIFGFLLLTVNFSFKKFNFPLNV